MSAKVSRRSLARYAADQLLAGTAASIVARHLAATLIDSQRQKEADLLLTDISYELQSRGRLAAATVTTASQLSARLRSEVTDLVKKSSKVQQVILTEQIDKKIIGGVRIETAERTWDKTVIEQLNKLRETKS
jgi:F0F1-type ATP synthase delta subunit